MYLFLRRGDLVEHENNQNRIQGWSSEKNYHVLGIVDVDEQELSVNDTFFVCLRLRTNNLRFSVAYSTFGNFRSNFGPRFVWLHPGLAGCKG